MTDAEIKNVMLNPTKAGLELIRFYRLDLKSRESLIRSIEKCVETILASQQSLTDIIAEYEQP